MFKRVDGPDETEGFYYTNSDGDQESVQMLLGVVLIDANHGDTVSNVYYSDIPKLIDALKAAYTHKTGLPL